MNCPKCNSIVSKRDTKCPVCGTALSVAPPSNPQQKSTTAVPHRSNAPKYPMSSASPKQSPVKNSNVQKNSYVNQKVNAPMPRRTSSPVGAYNSNDVKSPLLNLFSFFFPIIGYMYFFMNRNIYPARARFALHSAVAATVLSVVMAVFCVGLQYG